MNEQETEAVRRWYGEEEILQAARRMIDLDELPELEEYLQMTCLFPLSRHSVLPDYMRKEDGSPLFPHNFNPKNALEAWQDAIEIGWEVIQEKFGLSHDDVHRKIAKEQEEDWESFLKSVEQRKKERGLA